MNGHGYNFWFVIFCLPQFCLIQGCTDFQTESYDISFIDAQACSMLSDTTYIRVSTANISDYNPDWTHQNVAEIANQFIPALLADTIITLSGETGYLVDTGTEDSSYFALQSDRSGNLIIYFDQSVEADIFLSTGDILVPSQSVMPLESVGGCTYVDGLKRKPLIQTRIEYNTSATTYLFRLNKIDQTEKNSIRLAIIAGS